MVDALRTALRLLPVAKSGGSSRASLLCRHTLNDQPFLSSLSPSQHAVKSHCPQGSLTGFTRFAKAVLTYVGVGLSAVTANQFAGNPLTVHAKEIGKNRRDSSFMASEEARTTWCCKHILGQGNMQNQKACSDTLSASPANEPNKAKMEEVEDYLCLTSRGLETADMTDLPWQFGPSSYATYATDSVSSEKPSISGSMKVQSYSDMQMKNLDYSDFTDMELEWIWLTSQRHTESNYCKLPVIETKIGHEESITEAVDEVVHDGLEEFTETEQAADKICKVNEASIRTQTFLGTCLSEEPSLPGALSSYGRPGNLSMEQDEKNESACRLTSYCGNSKSLNMDLNGKKLEKRSSASWRTADRKELVALVQTTSKCIENCDLPSSKSSFSLASCDLSPDKTGKLGVSESLDKVLLTALLHGNEPTPLENRSLPLSPLIFGTSEPTPLQKQLPKISQPLRIPTYPASSLNNLQQNGLFSLPEKKASWKGYAHSSRSRNNDTLGEALCHSQTRAREAEKAAEQAVREKEQLQHLLLQEVSLSLTYRQWVRLLELENMWLKMHLRDHSMLWMEHMYINPSVSFELLSNNRWKHLKNTISHNKRMHHWSSASQGKNQCSRWTSENSNVVVGYTLGLAFALGLSLAGAGFMIGWSLGWMLLAY